MVEVFLVLQSVTFNTCAIRTVSVRQCNYPVSYLCGYDLTLYYVFRHEYVFSTFFSIMTACENFILSLVV